MQGAGVFLSPAERTKAVFWAALGMMAGNVSLREDGATLSAAASAGGAKGMDCTVR